MTYATLIKVSRWCSVTVVALWAVSAARWLMRPGIDWIAAIDGPMLLVAVLSWSNLRHLKSTAAKNPALLQTRVENFPVRFAIAAAVGLAAFAVGFGAATAMH